MKLVDTFGRVHTNLRISVTDRCNIRCFYCMPENVRFLPRREILNFDEITRVTQILSEMGIKKLRLTGGEPLVRKELPNLIKQLRALPNITEIALTTNGILLAAQAAALKDAGLDRINISLDSIDAETFQQITRRDELSSVMAGIAKAQEVGFDRVRINAVAIKGLSDSSMIPLSEFCAERGLHLRFIEFMPLDGERNWDLEQVLTGSQVLQCLSEQFGPPVEMKRADPSQPAIDFRFSNGLMIGLINSVSQPFCGQCNRLRLTAEGQLRNCLFSTVDFDLRALLRSGVDDAVLQERILECVRDKKFGHGIDTEDFEQPARAMYQIGG